MWSGAAHPRNHPGRAAGRPPRPSLRVLGPCRLQPRRQPSLRLLSTFPVGLWRGTAPTVRLFKPASLAALHLNSSHLPMVSRLLNSALRDGFPPEQMATDTRFGCPGCQIGLCPHLGCPVWGAALASLRAPRAPPDATAFPAGMHSDLAAIPAPSALLIAVLFRSS